MAGSPAPCPKKSVQLWASLRCSDEVHGGRTVYSRENVPWVSPAATGRASGSFHKGLYRPTRAQPLLLHRPHWGSAALSPILNPCHLLDALSGKYGGCLGAWSIRVPPIHHQPEVPSKPCCLASPHPGLLSSQFGSICHLSRSEQRNPSLLLCFRNSVGLSPSCPPPPPGPLPHAELTCSVRGFFGANRWAGMHLVPAAGSPQGQRGHLWAGVTLSKPWLFSVLGLLHHFSPC